MWLYLQCPVKLIYRSEDILFFSLRATFYLLLPYKKISLQIILLLRMPKFCSLPFSLLGRLDIYFISSMDWDDLLHGPCYGQISFVASTRWIKWNVSFAWMNCLPGFERNVSKYYQTTVKWANFEGTEFSLLSFFKFSTYCSPVSHSMRKGFNVYLL